MVALEREVMFQGRPSRRIAQIAEALVEKAATGDVQAFNSIADRIDGKPEQSLDVKHLRSPLEDMSTDDLLQLIADLRNVTSHLDRGGETAEPAPSGAVPPIH